MKNIRSVQNGKKFDSKFILLIVKAFYKVHFGRLKTLSVTGRSKKTIKVQ